MLTGDLVSYNMLRNEKYEEIDVLVLILDKLRRQELNIQEPVDNLEDDDDVVQELNQV